MSRIAESVRKCVTACLAMSVWLWPGQPTLGGGGGQAQPDNLSEYMGDERGQDGQDRFCWRGGGSVVNSQAKENATSSQLKTILTILTPFSTPLFRRVLVFGFDLFEMDPQILRKTPPKKNENLSLSRIPRI